MVSSNNRGQSDDSPHTADADEQNTTNDCNNHGSDIDGKVGDSIPANGDSPDTDELDEESVSSDEITDEIEEMFENQLERSDEFEERIEEIVENHDGRINFEHITLKLAREFEEDESSIDSALNVVASVKDGDVVGVASAAERAMGDTDLTWDMVKAGYGCDPSMVDATDVTTKSDVTSWAREKCVEFMNDNYHWVYLVDKNRGIEEFYAYDDDIGYYVDDAKDVVGRLMDEHLGRHSNTHEVNEVTRKLKAANKVTSVDEMNAGDKPLRCVENGVLDVETWELYDHDPEYRFTRRINAAWNPDVDTSDVEDFLDEITKNDIDAKVLAEMMGDTLTDHYKRQWFGMLYGGGANGKSVLLNVLRAVLGHENVSTESLHDIAETRWASGQMAGGMGAWANLDPEVSARRIVNTAPIKNNTGNDATSHEFKGQDKFSAVNTAKMIFGMNKPSIFDEEKRAIVRRIKPVELPYAFLPEDEVDDDDPMQEVRDSDKEDKLTTDESRAAWLQVMAEGLRRLRENDGFSYERSQRELFDSYQSAADTFWKFQHECLQNVRTTYNDTDTPVYLTFNEIHSAYASYCHDHDETPMPESEFAQELNKIGNLDIEKYHPGDADGANSRKYLAFTEHGFRHAITSTQKRFHLRVDEVDVPTMAGGDDSDTEHEGCEDLSGRVVSAITHLNEENDSEANFRSIVEHCRDEEELSGLLDTVDTLEEGGVIEQDDGVYHVVEDDVLDKGGEDGVDEDLCNRVLAEVKSSAGEDGVTPPTVAGGIEESAGDVLPVLESLVDEGELERKPGTRFAPRKGDA
ncbi:DNA primase family protein [Haloarchaeobius litoreus]|uniref:Phage/plasmid primase, P4 family n=1 Tax=Haloarchaeobius litoreus TaxID=755306 RepID=A0ABD6DKP6_9EURY|nr:phage/plasmid primase, P4 family [Haloarchaeobius litoreus]